FNILMALGNPVRDRRAERHSATRAEILEAAWALARSEGLAGISLRDLATAVGMQPPSLYSYFDSKNAIYDAMFRQGYEEMQSRDELFTTTPGAAAMKERVRGFLAFCTADPARYQLMFQRTLPGFTPSPDSYAISVRSLDRLNISLAADGVSRAADRDLFTALLSGLADQQIANDPGGDRWLRLVDSAVDMYLGHVGASAVIASAKNATTPTGNRRRP
ncbi:MAG TPA: TetR/AcrR family transcriptional regulator, partial [Mycobacteriales bacterium]|nr:TetR/AcrR family transcriptional regulator [Mycobacteriales bacterium]